MKIIALVEKSISNNMGHSYKHIHFQNRLQIEYVN